MERKIEPIQAYTLNIYTNEEDTITIELLKKEEVDKLLEDLKTESNFLEIELKEDKELEREFSFDLISREKINRINIEEGDVFE